LGKAKKGQSDDPQAIRIAVYGKKKDLAKGGYGQVFKNFR
jgi:hypothetical protein